MGKERCVSKRHSLLNQPANAPQVPWRYVVLERDEAFVNSDPFDGRWNEDSEYNPPRIEGEKVWGPWDDIYEGTP